MKYYLRISALAIVGGCFLFLENCKRDDDDKWPKEWPVLQEILDYYYFQPNTIWVYQNDKTGDFDTVIVKTAKKETFSANGNSYESADAVYYSFKEGYSYDYYCTTQGSSECVKSGSNHPCYTLMCDKYKPGNDYGESISWTYPFQKNYNGVADFSAQSSRFQMIDQFDSLIVNGTAYYKVIKVNITKALVSDRHDINIYWAKDIGIVKKEILSDTQTWNLTYFKIIK